MILTSTFSLGYVVDDRSNAILEKMKRSLGLHCTILRLNTVHNENDAVPIAKSSWMSAGEELAYLASPSQIPTISAHDKEALHRLTRDIVTQSIVPHMERCITTWNDQVFPFSGLRLICR
jgi:trafficking protein particle complex subunit 8